MAKNNINNPAAFPQRLSDDGEGMSLRDYFAAKALQGAYSISSVHQNSTEKEVAVECYKMADAMLEARKK